MRERIMVNGKNERLMIFQGNFSRFKEILIILGLLLST